MKLRAASRSCSSSNATSRSGDEPNMCRNDHKAKRFPRSFSVNVCFAPQRRPLRSVSLDPVSRRSSRCAIGSINGKLP